MKENVIKQLIFEYDNIIKNKKTSAKKIIENISEVCFFNKYYNKEINEEILIILLSLKDYHSFDTWYKIKYIPLIKIKAYLLYNRHLFFLLKQYS